MMNKFTLSDPPIRPIGMDFSRGRQAALSGAEWRPGQSSEYNEGFSTGSLNRRRFIQDKEAQEAQRK